MIEILGFYSTKDLALKMKIHEIMQIIINHRF